MNGNEIVSKLLSSRGDIISLLGEMISIPSPTGSEGAMARWLIDWLSRCGFEVDSFEIDPDEMTRRYPDAFYRYTFPYEGRPNVVGILRGAGGGRSLMLNFHLDVVDADPAAWSRPPWEATVEGDLLYGRGSCDMKGGAAACLSAVREIVGRVRLKGDLIVSGVIEEEGPGNGILALQAKGIQADGCLIAEPTELSIARALTGGVYGIITVSGVSSHGTTSWKGVNAVEKAYAVVRGIEKWRAYRKRSVPHPLFAHAPETPASSPVINITRVDGGNIGRVPSAVQVWTRATVMPGEDPKRIAREMEEMIISTATADDPWFREHPPVVSWVILGGRSYPGALDEDHPLVRAVGDSIHDVLGEKPVHCGLSSPADMQQLLNIEPKTPTVMYGPGSIYQAHTEDEWVPVEQLVQASAVIADCIIRWCGSA